MPVRFVNPADKQAAFVTPPAELIPAEKKSRAEIPRIDLTLPGRLRADDVQAILRIGATYLYLGIKSGRYPAPDFHEGRIPFWKNSTIRAFLEGGDAK